MNLLKKVLYIFDRKQKIRALELLILILIGTALETVGVTAIIPFVSAIIYPEQILSNKYAAWAYESLNLRSETEFIILLSVGLIIVYIVKNAYLCFMYSAQFKFIFNNQRRMAKKLLSAYLQEPYTFHLQHNSAELIHNTTADVDTFFSTVLYTINVLTDGLVCLALVIVSVIVDPIITISVAILLVAFVAIFYKKYRNTIKRLGNQRREYVTKNTQCIQQAFGGIKEVKLLRREHYFIDIYDRQYQYVAEAKKKVSTYSMFPKPLMETVCVAGLLSVVSVKIASGVNMESFIPALSVFALAVIRMLPSSSRIATNLGNIMFGKSAVDALYHDLKEVDKLLENRRSRESKELQINFENDIELKDISFKYENADKYVLNSINMRIPKNTSAAFVGTSGAGKTTLADIILGILESESGQILIDGKNAWDNIGAWQSKIGYIPQNIFITDDTIRRNVAFAIEDSEIDDARIWKALEEAQLKEFVESLEQGLDTVIGERGARISGGQRQRIGIARALYHNPEVLVLDEATSALDSETETAVMEAINALNGKKTLIIIAHRLSTIENCNYVFRIENGKASIEKQP
ncbi:MAG: ABC transporter ATP-binding protein [Lachnospiraceae bacterium]|nr:ABC transporter ATP-binding protein [Lachnospiraceae bacterium]